jgi:hypothetical protein
MNCVGFEREHESRLAGRQTDLSAEARRHLDTCAVCRRTWTVDRQLDRAIAVWQADSPPMPDRQRLLASILIAHTGVILRPSPSTPAVTWTIVAALTVMLCVGVSLWRDGATAPTVADRATPLTDSVATLWDGVQTHSQQAAVETVKRLDEWPLVALPVPSSIPTESAAEPIAPSRPWLEWSEPLGRQVGQAVQFLGDALPDPNEHSAGS